MPAPQPHAGAAENRQVHLDAVPPGAQVHGRCRLPERHAQASCPSTNDCQRLATCTGHGPIAAHDDRRLLTSNQRDRWAKAIHVVQVHVRHHGDAAVPGVSRVEPAAEPDLHQRDVDADLPKPAEDHRGEELELGRLTQSGRDPFGPREDLADEACEVGGRNELTVDLGPLSVADQVRLGCFTHPVAGGTQSTASQCDHAALAVRTGDERTAERVLRIAKLAQQRTRPTETQPDPEPAALLQGAHGLVVPERSQGLAPGPSPEAAGSPGHACPGESLTPWSARPRRRRTG